MTTIRGVAKLAAAPDTGLDKGTGHASRFAGSTPASPPNKERIAL